MGGLEGVLEAIDGPMFSGKSEEFIRRIRRHEYAGRKAQLFKSFLDERYFVDQIASHNGAILPCIPIKSTEELLSKLDFNLPVFGIEEVQFLDSRIIEACRYLADHGKIVIVSGLSMNFRGEPFSFSDKKDHVGSLFAISVTTTLRAICTYVNGDGRPCGREADMSQRLINGQPAPYDASEVFVGGRESYEARCRGHHFVPRRPEIVLWPDLVPSQ